MNKDKGRSKNELNGLMSFMTTKNCYPERVILPAKS